MESFKNICLGLMHGLWDSISGMSLLLYIDDEMYQITAAKEAERNRRLQERLQRDRPRTPSPTPSSASAMAREIEERERPPSVGDNRDERSLESLRKKPKAPEENKPKVEKKIAKKLLKCCLLNGGFTWLSIILFEQLLLPVLKYVLTLCYGEQSQDLNMLWGWLHSILSLLFGMMWVLPIFLLSKIVSSLWFADIANAAYQVRKGRPQMITSISKLVADFFFSLVVQALFLVQSMLVNLVPLRYVGPPLSFLHLCLLYALYSFEYKWFNMGWELHRRLSYIENNWPYFVGFGIPLTVLTSLTNSVIVSSCIFSIFFPLFILSGNEAKPLIGTTEIPLRLFSPVIFVSNMFFNRGGGGGGVGGIATSVIPRPRQGALITARMQQIAASKIAQQQQDQHQQLQYLQQQRLLEMQPNASKHHLHIQQQQYENLMRQRAQRPDKPRRRLSPVPSTGYRYQQPPQLSVHKLDVSTGSTSGSSTPSTRFRPQARDGMRYGGIAPLIPTPVPGAPRAPTAATMQR